MQWPLSVIDTHKDKVKVTHNLIFSLLIFVFGIFVTQTVQNIGLLRFYVLTGGKETA